MNRTRDAADSQITAVIPLSQLQLEGRARAGSTPLHVGELVAVGGGIRPEPLAMAPS